MKTTRLILLSAVMAMLAFTPLTESTINWKTTDLVLGEVPQHKPVPIEFSFTNSGNTPLLITNVQAGCGCTSVNYSKNPVMPGTSSAVTAVFNAAVKGAFKKTVTVTSNAEAEPRTLTFSGTVVETETLNFAD